MQLWKKLGCAASCVTASHRRHRINPFLPPFLPPFYSILSDKQIDLLRAKNKWVPPSQHLGVLVRVTGDRMSFFPSCCKLLFFGSRPLLKSLMALLIQERQQREPGWGKKYAVHRLNCHAELLFFFLGLTDHLLFSLCNSFFSVLSLASFCVLSCLSKWLSLFDCPWLFSCSAPSSRFCPTEDVSSRSSCQLCGLGLGAPRFQDEASTLSVLAVAWSQLCTTVGREGLSCVHLWTGWMQSSLKPEASLLLGNAPIGFCGRFTDLPEN